MIGMLKRLTDFVQTAPYRLGLKLQRRGYQRWIRRNERVSLTVEPMSYRPLLSVIVPVYNVKEEFLSACIESVRTQIYENWELCMADDASTDGTVRETLQKYEADEKIKIVWRKENGHISQATNSALELAGGEFVVFLDCDDTLSPDALYEVVKLLNRDRALDFIYSDEDKINEAGTKRHYPHFKAGWSPDTLMSMMYTSHLGVYRRSIVQELGGLRTGYEGAQDYDLTLRFTEKTDRIGHVPGILYHWREYAGSTSANMGAKPYVLEAQKRAKEDALVRRGLAGDLEFLEDQAQFRVNYIVPKDMAVSIILCPDGEKGVQKRCVHSLKKVCAQRNYEVLTADRESFLQQTDMAKGRLVLFLAGDMELVTPDGIDRLAGHAALGHVGAAGAKVLYPNGHTIYHCGISGEQEKAKWILRGMDDRVSYDLGINRVDYNYPAVAGGCLMIEREKYRQAAGDLSYFTDDTAIRLCSRLRKQGYYNVLRNDVVFCKCRF